MATEPDFMMEANPITTAYTNPQDQALTAALSAADTSAAREDPRAWPAITQPLLRNPEAGSESAVNEAKRVFALSKER